VERLDLASALAESKEILAKLEEESGISSKQCYQCGKCTAGCPVAFAMDYVPRQILRLLQLGFVEEALKAHSPWICASCQTCYTRCPREIDIPALMETLRIEGKKRGYVPEKEVDLFNTLFLNSVRSNGRVHEMTMVLNYNLRSGRWFQDALKSPKLLLDRKITIMPEKIKGRDEVEKIFKRALGEEGKN